jgi:hypothetical protein
MASLTGVLCLSAADDTDRLHAHQTGTAKKSSSAATNRPVPGADTSLDAVGLARLIDDEIAQRLQQDKLQASPRCDDNEFIRRVYLDLNGVIPPPDRVKAFLDSQEPDKREKLIDSLLADGRFGKQLADIWVHQIVSADMENRLLPTGNLRKWLEEAFNANKPWSKIAEELVTSSGSMDANPATMFFVTNNGPDKVTGQVSRLFLGVQLQCAQCHNHPFTDWKQEQYWGMAAFFMRVKQDGTAKQYFKDGSPISVSETAPVAVAKAAKKKKKDAPLPEGIKYVPAQYLTGEQPKLDKSGPARPALARWLTSVNNPYFARAMVNRTWSQFFGRGIVNPVDDMHDNNPATHPELLLALAEQFKRHNFDLKYLTKAIVLSETYQRSSKPIKGNEADMEMFSRMYVRALSPEQLVDSVIAVVGSPPGKGDLLAKKAAAAGKKGPLLAPRDQLVRFFRADDGDDPLEYQDGIPQVLRLMNGPLFNNGGKTLQGAMLSKGPTEAIDYIYMVALARHPTVQENQRLTTYVSQQKDKRTGYSDILWSLLNSSEFRLNH